MPAEVKSFYRTEDEVVAYLEATLARARRGELVGVLVIGAEQDGNMTRAMHGAFAPFTLIGVLETFKLEILARECLTSTEEVPSV